MHTHIFHSKFLIQHTLMTTNNPKPRRVCFSYAAYAKNLIEHLKSADIPVEKGLSDVEISTVESDFHFTFPPDLRCILREGLPVGPGFPNWRSSSRQQLEILINLPILGLRKQVSGQGFWMDCSGKMPDGAENATSLAKRLLKMAPILVPIYRHFYVPSKPCLAGNPVFHVHGGVVEMWSFDIAGFFQKVEFTKCDNDAVFNRPSLSSLPDPPAWAATEARRIEFWTELAETVEARVNYGGECSSEDLGGWLEEEVWRLREGGWKEEDVREMMMMDGCDKFDVRHNGGDVKTDIEGVELLSKMLLHAGWSTEDVVDSLGSPDDYDFDLQNDSDSYFDLHQEIVNGFDENTQ